MGLGDIVIRFGPTASKMSSSRETVSKHFLDFGLHLLSHHKAFRASGVNLLVKRANILIKKFWWVKTFCIAANFTLIFLCGSP
jgi:hypothetical protein